MHCTIVIVATVSICTCLLFCIVCYSAIRLLGLKCAIKLSVSVSCVE